MQQPSGGGGGGGAEVIRLRGTGGSGTGSGALIRSLLEEVRPGDLITSDFMRRLLRGLAGLEEYLGQLDDSAGVGTVPDVIFLRFTQAVKMLEANQPSLSVEDAFDPSGNRVEPGRDRLRNERIVLAQFPVPGAKITGDRGVKLLVSTDANRLLGWAEFVADKGPGLFDLWQKNRRVVDTPPITGGNIPQSESGTTAPAAEAAPAASSKAGSTSTGAAAAKRATKSRARRKPAKPAEG